MAKNFDELTLKAGKLGITFEQAGTILKDAFAAKVDELNQKIGLSSKFASAMFLLIKNMETLINLTLFLYPNLF